MTTPADVLLLRPLRHQQPPRSRGAARRAHRPLRGRSVLLGSCSASRGATSFAGVPYTFDLLDRVGFASMELPTPALPHPGRRTAGAGPRCGATPRLGRAARLGPVRHVRADRGHGPDGLPAARELAAEIAREPSASRSRRRPSGSDPVPREPGRRRARLHRAPTSCSATPRSQPTSPLGRSVQELRTGDLARQHPNGLYEVVGRRSRFVKIVGLRIDLGQVEKVLAGLGLKAACAGTDAQLVAAVEGDPRRADARQDPGTGTRPAPRRRRPFTPSPSCPASRPAKPTIPPSLSSPFRLSEAKRHQPPSFQGPPAPRYRAANGTPDDRPAATLPPEDAKRIFAEALERDDIGDDDTFVSLGGDSLSYVAASVRLERALGHLPANWHVTPVKDLTPRKLTRSTRRLRRIIAPLRRPALCCGPSRS